MAQQKTIVITWMPDANGVTEVAAYENATASVLNGVLNVYPHRKTGSGAWVLDGEAWHFPLSNIRAWGPEEWDGKHGILLHARDVRDEQGG